MIHNNRATALFSISCAVVIAIQTEPAPADAAQPDQIVGYVFDHAGNPLIGVKLLATPQDGDRSASRSTYSNDEGAFTLGTLAPGVYELEAKGPRLKSAVTRGVEVPGSLDAEQYFIMEASDNLLSSVGVSAADIAPVTHSDALPSDDEGGCSVARTPTPRTARLPLALLAATTAALRRRRACTPRA